LVLTLSNTVVRLEPLTEQHIPALLNIAQSAPEVYALTTAPTTLEAMQAYVAAAQAARDKNLALPFATIHAQTGEVVGSTRFGNLEHWAWAQGNPHQKQDGSPDAAEIGWTWLAPQAQRTAINTNAKLLMLEYAFEVWQVRRMTLKTDARNQRSRNAILRLGATFEGILRAHVPAADGGVRDSAMYSILAAEWAGVKTNLEARVMGTLAASSAS
jgi:N-acetyltransferase